MASVVYFHIGSMKTGSTGLQRFCYENRDALLDVGIDYIQFEPPKLHLPRWANADFLLQPDFDAKHVRRKIEESPADIILISEEGLMSRPQVWTHPIFDKYQRKIILYIRNSVELVASWAGENSLPYNFRQKEHASGRGVVSVDEGIGIWSNAFRGMLYGVANTLIEHPHIESHLRLFPPKNDTELVVDFLRQFGLDKAVVDSLAVSISPVTVNEGRSRKFCDVAYVVSELTKQYEIPHIYSNDLVTKIDNKIQSGDRRKVIHTLPYIEKLFIQKRLSSPVRSLLGNSRDCDIIDSVPSTPADKAGPYNRLDLDEVKQIFFETLIRDHV